MPISIINTALALGIVTTEGAAGHAEQPHANQQHCSHQVQMHQKDHQHRAQAQQKFNQQKTNEHTTAQARQTQSATQTTATTQTTASSSGITAPNAFLKMVAQRESGGDITAVNPTSGAAGKYQFMQSTWDTVAPAAWKGKSPASAPESVQDAAALALYNLAGTSPWAL